MKGDSLMAGCRGHDAKFDGVPDDYKRRLWIVIALNATIMAGLFLSSALQIVRQALAERREITDHRHAEA
jgi:hypothetical protein